MINLLQKVYNSEDAKKAFDEIEELKKRYQSIVKAKRVKNSKNDIVLITYGDQVQRVGEKPLKTLGKFFEEYIKNLFSTVHILPFYPYTSDDGFSVVDYKKVSPTLGSWDEIKSFSKNYKLMFDGVINHISQSSHWFQGFLQNDEKYKDFFVEVDPNINLSQVVRPRTLPLIHEYKDVDKKQRYIWTTFSKDQVDLNFANYKVLIAVLDVLLFYVQNGASLIRLDAIAFIYKKIGTSCIHLPQTHYLIQIIRDVIASIDDNVLLVTETNVPHNENISYFGDGKNEAHMVYNFALPPLVAHSMLTMNASTLTTWAKSLKLSKQRVCFFNFTASHDGCGLRALSGLVSDHDIDNLVKTVQNRDGFVSYRTGENGDKVPYELNASYIDIISDPNDNIDLRVKKMILSQAISLVMPGVAGIYFHSMFGSVSDIEAVQRSDIFRSINREKFDLEELRYKISDTNSLSFKIYHKLKYLLTFVRDEKAFYQYGDYKILELDKSLFTIDRYHEDEEILAIHNFSNFDVNCVLPKSIKKGAYDIITNNKINIFDFKIAPYEVLWIKNIEDLK
jgi:sucrose phosphorylase